MNDSRHDEVRDAVRQTYARVAESASGDGNGSGCCGGGFPLQAIDAEKLGYARQDLEAVPEGAEMGVGCGNPQAIAALKAGETVLDLGSGGGFDCFLAARQVGDAGRVIGVDMTPEMLGKARVNAAKGGYANVEFRLGGIEHLPVADQSVNVILSNCVINLSPNKRRVFAEAFRVLKPGGRLAIADVVATAPLPAEMKSDMGLYACCASGAALIVELEDMLREAGFEDIRIVLKDESRAFIREWAPGSGIEDYVVSATIEAVKPPHPEPASLYTESVAELVAMGAAIAANCEPCFKYHYQQARKLGVSREDMMCAVKTAQAVKETPARAMLQLAERFLEGDPTGLPVVKSCCG
ncbi:arsenite methyltransferase [Methylomagnum sp.]